MLEQFAEAFYFEMSIYQIYALFFLMGSLTVASISDIKNTAAQKEFFHFWLVFTGVMFFVDIYPNIIEGQYFAVFSAKWIIIAVFCILSSRSVGVFFGLAKMDVAAVAAISSLFNIYSVIIFFVLLKVVSLIERPLLSSDERYPFLPVVLTSALIILLANLYFI